jgi:hypothetical protein
MAGNSEMNSSPLGKVNLRANLLKGNIVLANYGVSKYSQWVNKLLTYSMEQFS